MAVASLFATARAYAQPPEGMKFRHFSVRQGLSDGHVNALVQDERGYLWIGTTNGLNRFNGYSFKVFRNDPTDPNTLAGNNIQCLFIDSGGKIWAGLLGGRVSCYDPQLETFRNYICYFTTEETDGDVSAITEDDRGYLWVTVDRRGLVRLDPESGDIIRYEHDPDNPSSLSHNAVTGIAKGANGKMWVTSWGGGLDLFDPQTGTFTHYPYPGESDARYTQLKCLLLDSEGDIWLGSTYLGVFYLGTEHEQWKHFPGGFDYHMAGTAVQAMAEGPDSDIWVGFANGLSVYHRNTGAFSTFETENGEYGLQSQDVSCLLSGNDGSMWVGTSSGLYQYNPSLIQFGQVLLPGGEVSDDYIQQVLQDSKGGLWIRTREGLFYYANKGSLTAGQIWESWGAEENGRALFEDSRGHVWIGNNASVVIRYDLDRGRTAVIPIPLRTTKGFYEDSDGIIWIATELGLLSYDPEMEAVREPLFSSGDLIFPSDKTNAVLRDSYGNLWVGTGGGLKCYSTGEKLVRTYTITDSSSLSDNDITALYEDSRGILWIGTASGLDRYDREKDSFTLVRRPGERAGFPVMGIVEDDQGTLWMTTSSGLVMYHPEEESLHFFDEDDGLPSRVFVRGALCKTPEGEILAGTAEGAVRFRPEEIVLRHAVPQAQIEDFLISSRHVAPGPGSVLSKVVGLTDKVRLNHRQSTLTFQFAAVDYLYPGKIYYAYRLAGADKEWLYTGPSNRQATYVNLPPGSYTFEVEALDDHGDRGVPARLEIDITPPFYRTVWAYILYALLLVALVAELLLRIKRRNDREMERLLATQQHEMDELKFKFFTNISHEFRTSLTLIMGPLEYLMRDKQAEGYSLMEIMRRSAERLRRLVNQLLDFRKIDAGKMEVFDTTQDLVPFLRELFDTYGYYAGEKDLEYVFTTDADSLVMAFDKDKVDKMVYNLLSNAFKYTDKGGKVTLDLTHTGEEVAIRVTDNGAGISKEAVENLFVRFYQATDSRAIYRGGSGLGLNMTHELAVLMGGRIEVESEPGKGSAFTIHLPLKVSGQADLPAESSLPEEGPEVIPEPTEREKELILVVEDNPDMQAYIRTVIGDTYHLAVASDGKEGLERAVELMPDIVISDVMMPRMDGLQMFAHIKEDERISHIPVILLTAIQDEERIASSLQLGIDDYVTKPFSPALLLARISRILDTRKEMWEKKTYSTHPFAVKLTEIITERLSDSSLSLEYLAGQLNMSASQLTRKTKSIMDTTPYSLIIKLRMEQAVRYLKEGEYNISETAYRCGYQEISNFSRAFTRYWGESPSQYLKKVK